jgi:tRNA nucleotidyltransferase (CCA-adding enzyme)
VDDALLSLLEHPAAAALVGEPDVWVVGGAVRDALLGRPPGELDFVVVGDALGVARRAAERLGGGVTVHARFRTATVHAAALTFDLVSARRESYLAPGALPDVALGASLEEDLRRRDFTVNAMAVALAGGELRAVGGARRDLVEGVLRVLHDASFLDDPTRLLRLARYGARLGFAAEAHTAALAGAAVAGGALETVTGTRLGRELRMLALEPQPAALLALGAHGLGDALLGGAFAPDAALVERAVALCPADGRADLVALAVAWPGADAARLRHLAFPAHEREIVVAAAGAAALDDLAGLPPSAVAARLRVMAPEAVAAAGARGGAEIARRWLEQWRHVRPDLTGRDLLRAGLRGPQVGRALEGATAALLDGRARTREQQLVAALEAGRRT